MNYAAAREKFNKALAIAQAIGDAGRAGVRGINWPRLA